MSGSFLRSTHEDYLLDLAFYTVRLNHLLFIWPYYKKYNPESILMTHSCKHILEANEEN